MSTTVPDNAPKPRLAHVKKRADFNGYGFNLHAEKGKAGQFIGKVDPGSPAELAGLREGDRIVEVNGTNIGNENHQQVVQRVKAVPDETKLLVVDAETDKYYKEHKIVVRGDMPNIASLSSDSSSSSVVTNGSETPPKTRADSIPGDAPSPRCCHLKIWPDFQGYGFNLHAEKGKPGQFIGKVDEDSPAEAAGLREGDRIVEINDENIGQSNHKEVVSKIKSRPNETKLLVVDPEAEKYYRERDIAVSHSMSNVVFITCPDTKPTAAASNGSEEVHAAVVNHVQDEPAPTVNQTEETRDTSYTSEENQREDEKTEQNNNLDEAEDYDVIANVPKPDESDEEEPTKPDERSESPQDPPPPQYEEAATFTSVSPPKVDVQKEEPKPVQPEPQSPSQGPVVVGGIEFAGSAKEARERMSKKRRDEVKAQQMSAKDKYDMYMRM